MRVGKKVVSLLQESWPLVGRVRRFANMLYGEFNDFQSGHLDMSRRSAVSLACRQQLPTSLRRHGEVTGKLLSRYTNFIRIKQVCRSRDRRA